MGTRRWQLREDSDIETVDVWLIKLGLLGIVCRLGGSSDIKINKGGRSDIKINIGGSFDICR